MRNEFPRSRHARVHAAAELLVEVRVEVLEVGVEAIRAHSITTPSSRARAPPESPVPAPRATKGTPKARQVSTRSGLALRIITTLADVPAVAAAKAVAMA